MGWHPHAYDGSHPQSSQAHLRAAVKMVMSNDRLAKAEHLFSSGHYLCHRYGDRAAILEAFIVLDVGLRQLAARNQSEKLRLDKTKPMGEVVRKLEGAKILSVKERVILVEVMRIRNNAVHLPEESTREDASKVMAAATEFLTRFDEEK
jgi:hypothetical protein